MQQRSILAIVLSVLLLAALTGVASATEPKTKITYIAYSESEALKIASQANDYSNLIEYNYIGFYNGTSKTLSDEIIDAAETGFLGTQDAILISSFYSGILNNETVMNALENAHGSGTMLYSIKPMGATPPAYFDYMSDGKTSDPIATYYNNMDTEGEGLENAKDLLLSLTMRSRITYIAYSESEALEIASETNDHSNLIEYNYIGFYNGTSKTLSDEIIDAAETGFLATQDAILISSFYSGILNNETVMNALENAHGSGTMLYSIKPMGTTPPAYFDYMSDGKTSDPIATYYNNMGTEGEALENAKNLLLSLTMRSKITYIAYSGSDALEMASQTNDYSDIIEYNYIGFYNGTSKTLSEEIIDAAKTGFLGTQDAILISSFYSGILNNETVMNALENAHGSGTMLYSIKPMGATPPAYFDYRSDGYTSDPIATYYNNMGAEGEALENAKDLLLSLTMRSKITYIAYSGSDALEMASQTNDYSNLIEYNYIGFYNVTSKTLSDEIIDAAETGFLGTQDVILISSGVLNNKTVISALENAHDNGTMLYSIKPIIHNYIGSCSDCHVNGNWTMLYGMEPMGTTQPAYFDYMSDGYTSDPIATYYNNMGTEGEGLENAKDLLLSLTMRSRITYIAYSESEALKIASQTNDYSDLIEYNYIGFYNGTSKTLSKEIIDAASTGFLGTQDTILISSFYSGILNNETMMNAFENAHDNGTMLYSIKPMGATPPAYFDYRSDGYTSDPIATYYNKMGTEGEALENAKDLLLYLATDSSGFVKTTTKGNTKIDMRDFLFVLGNDFNKAALSNVSQDTNISAELNLTIFASDDPVPEGFDFSSYGMIFIESQDEALVNDWSSSIKSAKAGGAMVIGYNLSSNITLTNVNLYSDEYTDIERYWIQGGEENMKDMLMFMGQNFTGLWEGEEIPEPVILQEKVNITFVMGVNYLQYNLQTVIDERSIITDRFNINIMTGEEAAANLTDATDQDIVILNMISVGDIISLQDVLSEAKDNGSLISLVSSLEDTSGLSNLDTLNPPHNAILKYIENGGATNMENMVRYAGAELCVVYMEYSPVAPPEIPDNGIYHPDAFPHVFEDSTEYLEWYANRTADEGHIYDPEAPTIGIINYAIQKEPIYLTTDDAVIRSLESKGCNVIYSTQIVCNDDVDYFTKDGEVLIDAIIHLKAFYLNYGDPDEGVEYLKQYNVPILKGIQDPYTTPEEFYNSTHGTDTMALPSMVTQPEVDGCLDFIWISGSVPNPADPKQVYYKPIMSQVEFLCDRAIGWAELGKVSNEDKKITILYYNHDGGKENIGASYLDIGESFTLMLERMQAEGYDIGNGTIPNGSEFIDLFITSRNVGAWAPGELEKVVESRMVTLWPVEEYLPWYEALPESVRTEVEETWGEAPGDIMVYENESGKYFVMPTVQLGNVIFMPQPTKAKLSDESLIYHNSTIPLTHQYLAAYFWINQVYDADAIIHFGTHGSMEWSPGKEIGLWEYDYPSICADDTPIIYPYIMDNVGEGSQAKHRGYAVIIDHLTPPIVEAGIYGDLTTIHDKIHSYGNALSLNDTAKAALYRNSTIELYVNLSLESDLGVSADELQSMSEEEFDDFTSNTVHEYLHALQDTLMPYGIHTFGVAPEDEKLVCMVKSILGSDLTNHIYNVLPKNIGSKEDWKNEADSDAMLLLNATLLYGTNISTAQLEILGFTDDSITADLELAIEYADKLDMTTREIDQTIRALNAEYIEPGPGNDPIRNPDALPTGRNFYGFDQRKFPDEETSAMGAILADQLLVHYYSNNNNTYPNKVSYVLWAMETLRHGGLMEAQIHSLLGVEPVRDQGRITGFKVIPLEDMDHPRIDVLIHSSGLYRDTFPYQLQLIDEAVRMVAELNETNETNYVRWNSLKMEEVLIANGYNESEAYYLSRSRVFAEAPGNYDNRMEDAIAASNTWDNESKLADLFISTSSYIYGKDIWGNGNEDLFKMNLMDVDAAVHSDSSNLFGLLDADGHYGYLGSIGLTIRVLTGETPELYIANQESADNPQMITLNEAFRNELRARNFNPKWITGMMESDYAGARQMMKFAEYLWGWDVVTPDMVTDSDWNEVYNIYIKDKYDLGVDEFLKTENPYQYQSITARMLETIRKDYWDASDEITQSLVKEYVESVVNDGVTCCHHTCGNPLLDEYIQSVMTTTGIVDTATMKEYQRLMEEATHRTSNTDTTPTETVSKSRSSSSTGTELKVTETGSGETNQTMMTDSGAGMDLNTPAPEVTKSTPDNYVEGYEMTKESVTNPETSSGFSGSDILASLLVIAGVGAIYVGFVRRRKF
ncbi:cobaltochelatase subunit CobN [Methanolobus psychrotolerans]|uniref:cobaltochelatase subunit CobN n=1 Tax=Methanolobus psychrotolerans TaxID=1874706 RepID=UPI001F5D2C91|nr:cobaltochelatase subunit CobN [Methanolobus psychrotolerans]